MDNISHSSGNIIQTHSIVAALLEYSGDEECQEDLVFLFAETGMTPTKCEEAHNS